MNYTSEDFRIQYMSSYTLYINSDYIQDQIVVVGGDGEVLAMMIYDSVDPTAEAMRLLSLPFQRVYVVLPHQNLIWVPTDVLLDQDLNNFLPFFDVPDKDTILIENFDNLGITALYQYDMLLFNRWKKIFEQARFVPVFEVLINQVQPRIPIKGKVLGVHIYDHLVDLFLFSDGEFKFYNTFEVATIDDLSYFVLQLLKNNGVIGKVDKALLSGRGRDSEWGKRLEFYTEDLDVFKPKIKWSSTMDEVSKEIDNLGVLADTELCV